MVTEEACRAQRLMKEQITERALINQNTTDCYPNRARCFPTRNPANPTRDNKLWFLGDYPVRMEEWKLDNMVRLPLTEDLLMKAKLGTYFKDDNSGCASSAVCGKTLKCYLWRASNAEGCWQKKENHRTVSIKSKPGQWWKKAITKEPLPYRHPEKWVF